MANQFYGMRGSFQERVDAMQGKGMPLSERSRRDKSLVDAAEERKKATSEAFGELTKFRSKQRRKAKRIGDIADSFSDLAGTVDVGKFAGAPVYTGGRDFLAGISSGLNLGAMSAERKGGKVDVFDPFEDAGTYMNKIESSMNPIESLVNRLFGGGQ